MGSASSASLVQINAMENQQRPHSLIIRRFRARAAVRSLLSALAYNSMAVHEPRKDVTRQVGASSCRERPQGLLAPYKLRSSLSDETPVRSLCSRVICTRCGMIGADVRAHGEPGGA